jgi:hypothetical protein
MTTAQRTSVVELLRRAAALESYEERAHGSFLRSAAIQLSTSAEIEELARLALGERDACSGLPLGERDACSGLPLHDVQNPIARVLGPAGL